MKQLIGLMCVALLAACGAPRSTAAPSAEPGETPDIQSDTGAAVIEDGAQPVDETLPRADAALSTADSLDPALIGVWINEDNLNSSGGAGGFASLSTVMTMQLSADGRVVQSTLSAGGGGDWSYDGGETVDFDGEWRAGGGVLYVKGMGLADFTPASRYEFSGDYLVTHNDQGRLIWQRQH